MKHPASTWNNNYWVNWVVKATYELHHQSILLWSCQEWPEFLWSVNGLKSEAAGTLQAKGDFQKRTRWRMGFLGFGFSWVERNNCDILLGLFCGRDPQTHFLQVKFKAVSLGIKKWTQGLGVGRVARTTRCSCRGPGAPSSRFSSPTWKLTTIYNFSPGGSESIFCLGHKASMWCIYMHASKTLKHVK